MHTLARNKQTIYYATVLEKEEQLDENCLRTGQYDITYNKPVAASMNIRWDDGTVRLEGYGLNSSARRRLVTDDMNCPIGIDTILWIGVDPGYSGSIPYNYVVVAAPEKSLNHIAYIVEEVNASYSAE